MSDEFTIPEELKPSKRLVEDCGPCNPSEPVYYNPIKLPNLAEIIANDTLQSYPMRPRRRDE